MPLDSVYGWPLQLNVGDQSRQLQGELPGSGMVEAYSWALSSASQQTWARRDGNHLHFTADVLGKDILIRTFLPDNTTCFDVIRCSHAEPFQLNEQAGRVVILFTSSSRERYNNSLAVNVLGKQLLDRPVESATPPAAPSPEMERPQPPEPAPQPSPGERRRHF
jgi:hypothetical protein